MTWSSDSVGQSDVDGNSTTADGQFDHGNGNCSPTNSFVGSDATTGDTGEGASEGADVSENNRGQE